MSVPGLVIGPWTFEWVPDGDDPGVGNLTVRSSWGNPGFREVAILHVLSLRGV